MHADLLFFIQVATGMCMGSGFARKHVQRCKHRMSYNLLPITLLTLMHITVYIYKRHTRLFSVASRTLLSWFRATGSPSKNDLFVSMRRYTISKEKQWFIPIRFYYKIIIQRRVIQIYALLLFSICFKVSYYYYYYFIIVIIQYYYYYYYYFYYEFLYNEYIL